MKEKLSRLISEYGGVGIAVFAAIWILTFGGSIVALQTGLGDPMRAGLSALLAWGARIGLPFSTPDAGFVSSAGAVVIGWLVLRVTLPVRILLTVALTPSIARWIQRRRG